jgi:hypothetical protein
MLHCGLVITDLALASAARGWRRRGVAAEGAGGSGGGGGGSAADASRAKGGDSGWRRRPQDEQVGPHELRAPEWSGTPCIVSVS